MPAIVDRMSLQLVKRIVERTGAWREGGSGGMGWVGVSGPACLLCARRVYSTCREDDGARLTLLLRLAPVLPLPFDSYWWPVCICS